MFVVPNPSPEVLAAAVCQMWEHLKKRGRKEEEGEDVVKREREKEQELSREENKVEFCRLVSP